MEFLNVIAAAVACFATGAIWYMSLAKPWMAASGIESDENGQPVNNAGALPYIMSFVAALMVAGMMRHVFATSGVDTISEGVISGLGIGAFFISPWIMMNNGYQGNPFKLTLIDGGYATVGCAVIGAVLTAF